MNPQLQNAASWMQTKLSPYYRHIFWATIFVAIAISLYLLYKYYKDLATNRPYLIKGPKDASVGLQIPGTKIPKSLIGTEFSFSFWINVEDWGHNFNKPKHVFHIGDAAAKSVCPGVWLYPKNNNIMIRVDTHANTKQMNPNKDASIIKKELPCDITDIPVQRWVHIAVILINRTVDVYVNGKLTRSCVLENVPKLNNGDLYINQNGGYAGSISDLLYYNQALSPNDIYSLYLSGKEAFVLYNYLNNLPI
tara:strand:- start:381 stop:1130 length:750 start_codon:yes stop_codon:yes gene_type:complete